MSLEENPFEYDAASNLTDEMIADYYIDDFNYSRFIQSKRNIFLVGDRGSGKTMALLFNRWRLQKLLAERSGRAFTVSTIGVYVPCNTPLTHKTEYQLLSDDFRARVLSEHFLVLSIAYGLVETLLGIPQVLDGADESLLRDESEFVLGGVLPQADSFFHAILQFLQRELLDTQNTLNSRKPDAFYENTSSFASVLVPLINMCSKHLPTLRDSHFLLLIDDAHALNDFQIHALNSWIAYRDHSLFSFKVAITKVGFQTRLTTSGGSILEGHDYIRVDLEGPYLNPTSRFYGHACTLIAHRLKKASIEAPPEEFFPASAAMERALKKSEDAVKQEAVRKFGESKDKSKERANYVHRHKRVHYFKNRPVKATLPPYSGFETIVYLSTGVVRNLLEPCFWMFDRTKFLGNSGGGSNTVQRITPEIQTKIIVERSRRLWTWLREGISQDIDGCTSEDGKRVYRLVDALALHFRERLLHHESEPGALSFTISERDTEGMKKLTHLLDILRKAQLLYVRDGSAKDSGRREIYYVPNRMLWPARGLDPHGQHARVSISARVLWKAAAERGKIDTIESDERRSLWDEDG